jgi:DNA-directed RNA polymerase subunit M/transcription elongation factor TFIIS
MKFCVNCDNMYYTRVADGTDSPDMLKYYCLQCGHEKDVQTKYTRVMITNTTSSKQLASRYINKYTKLDPSLPRITTIDCPNVKCVTNPASHENNTEGDIPKKDILYIRYDNVNMKFMYLCVHCDHVWDNSNNL